MDIEKLIALVEECRSLWDQKCKQYHNRDLNKKLWKEVAEKMSSTEDAVRQKWRGLRDTFRKELQKLRKKKSGEAADDEMSFHCKWQFFSDMLFLQEQFILRKTSGNISDIEPHESNTYVEAQHNYSPDVTHSDDQYLLQKGMNMETEDEPMFATPSHSKKRSSVIHDVQLTGTTLKKKRNERDSALKKLLQVEEEKLSHLKNSSQKYQDQDDDYYFALSLVPYLRQLPTHRKLLVRTKFQEILAQEHEALYSSQHTPQLTPVPPPSPSLGLLQPHH